MATLAAPFAPLSAFGRRSAITATATPRMGWLKRMQIAQMSRALNAFSDLQLKQMGITRADIPAHARRMIDAEV